MCRLLDRFKRTPQATPEALRLRHEIDTNLRPRAERAVNERDRLLRENNYTARIRALYLGEQS